MKATGIVRKVDELGRIVLPMELRKTLNIQEKDPVEIFVNGRDIVLRKYEPGCDLCGSIDDELKMHRGKSICVTCINTLKGMVK